MNTSGACTRSEVYAGSRHVATYKDGPTGTTYFSHTDWLGTERVRTDKAGMTVESCTSLPFGGERVVTNTCPQNYKFQGKERDAESGHDDFGARYYSSNYGRWLSPDWPAIPAPVPYANLTNPQTLNLYAFVHDNPETFADLDGHGDKTANQPKVEVANCGQPDYPACSVTTGQPQTLVLADLKIPLPDLPCQVLRYAFRSAAGAQLAGLAAIVA